MSLYHQMFNIEYNKEKYVNGYLYPQPEPDLEDEELLYDEYLYEVYKALTDYKEMI